MSAERFTLRATSGDLMGWRVEDNRVDRLWMPLTGPTSIAVLRVFEDLLDDAAREGWGTLVNLTFLELGQRVGVPPPRAHYATYRLLEFGMILEDQLDTTYELPAFLVGGTVPALSAKLARKLPASVLAAHGALL